MELGFDRSRRPKSSRMPELRANCNCWTGSASCDYRRLDRSSRIWRVRSKSNARYTLSHSAICSIQPIQSAEHKGVSPAAEPSVRRRIDRPPSDRSGHSTTSALETHPVFDIVVHWNPTTATTPCTASPPHYSPIFKHAYIRNNSMRLPVAGDA